MRKKARHKTERLEIRTTSEFKKVLNFLCDNPYNKESQSSLLQDALFKHARGGVWWATKYPEEIQLIIFGEVIFHEKK